MAATPRAPAVGIDLGTTYSCVAVWEDGNCNVIANKLGERTTPSWVGYRGNERLVGSAAKKQSSRNLTNTVFEAKRLIGRRFDDPTVQADKAFWPFEVVEGSGGLAAVRVEYQGERHVLTPEQVSAAILQHMRDIASDYLGQPVTEAVITVPAYFNDGQRQATKDAAEMAGLRVSRIINEPTAAALAYGLEKITDNIARNLMIFDMGGGTLDVTILTVDHGVFEVRSTCGDTHLGGQDLDARLVSYIAEKFQEEHKIDISFDAKAIKKVRDKVQDAKHELSLALMATVEIDGLCDGIDFDINITRTKFNELCMDLFQRVLIPVEKALADAKMVQTDIDEIIMIGGSTRVVAVQDILEGFFSGKQLNKRINPDEAVAIGAAIQAATLSLSKEERQGTRLEGYTLLDVTPMSLGIELKGGKMSVIIPRNTSVPFSHTKMYYNNEDNQTEAIIEVFEGESKRTSENRLLGKFAVSPLPQKPRGKVGIEVTFVLDANGILEVEATVSDSGVKSRAKIEQYKGLNSDVLSRDQVEKMVAGARVFEQAALEKELRRAALDSLETYINELEENFRARGGSGPLYESALASVRGWITVATDCSQAEINEKRDYLTDLFLGSGASGAGGAGGSSEPAEFEALYEA